MKIRNKEGILLEIVCPRCHATGFQIFRKEGELYVVCNGCGISFFPKIDE